MVALFGLCEWLCEDFFAQLLGEEVLDLDDDDERFATLEFLGLDLDACACVKDAEMKKVVQNTNLLAISKDRKRKKLTKIWYMVSYFSLVQVLVMKHWREDCLKELRLELFRFLMA